MTSAIHTSSIRTTKDAIARSFSQQASTYAKHASVQARSAQMLATFIQQNVEKLPAGDVLELGCGTGIFTEHLLEIFPDRCLTASDLSISMLDQCKGRLHSSIAKSHNDAAIESVERVQLVVMDAENPKPNQSFSVVAASFCLQWVEDFLTTLHSLISILEPNGQLVFSVPIVGSFDEWSQQCRQANVTYTANDLPDKDALINWCREKHLPLEWTHHPIVCEYDSALDFFRSLKNVGANVNTSGQKLTRGQLLHLIKTWDANTNGRLQVTYEVLCARITREVNQ
jgi:malonyl-ACP O-methyltransferase BioC